MFSGWDKVGTLISKFEEKYWDIDIKIITVSHCHHIAHSLTLSCRPMSFESAKATETASELRKAREKIHDQEISLNSVEQEKKRLDLKVKELESVLDRRPQVSSIFVANKSE